MIGIVGAMPEEISSIVACLEQVEQQEIGNRTYFSGLLWNKPTVIVFSRWGKVAAATTVSTLILKFNITEVIFTGVAGAIHDDIHIGDIVIGQHLYQHDMDARPLMPQFEIPLLGKTYFETSSSNILLAEKAANTFLSSTIIDSRVLREFHIISPKVHVGDIASGDQFIAAKTTKLAIQKNLPSILCVEMEGAAVAQVCDEFKVPFTIIRTISDSADHEAHLDFPKFIQEIACNYAVGIVKAYYKLS